MRCKKNLHMFLKNMNISPVSFCAKHRDIRKADDIMRHSNNCFPMFSPSYAISHWNRFTQNTNQAELERTAFFNKYSKILDEKVRNKYINDDDSYHLNLFEPLKKEKLGNCKENAIALIATLFANGYQKAARIGLEYEINFIDKKTKKVASTSVFNFDHTCVMTTMDNKEKRKKFEDLIIIDGWLQKTMPIQEARKMYLNMVSDYEKNIIRKQAVDKFKEENIDNPNFNLDDYEMKEAIEFGYNDKYTKEQAQEFGKLISEKYPELKLNYVV